MSEEQKTLKKKISVGGLIFFLVLLAITVASFVLTERIFGEKSVFNKAVVDNSVVNALYHKIPSLIRTVQIVCICWLVNWLVRVLLKKMFSKNNRGITIVKLLSSFIKYVVAIIAILLVLGAWGVDTATLIASAGIVGLIVGLGAQSLVADILAGVFIVFEGSYQVGDIVVIDGWRGTVEEIGIRSTRIVDAGGNVKIVNNSSITSVINQTKELSVAKATISIEYGESIPRVELVIRDHIDKIKENIPEIVEGPYYKGVTALGASSVDLLFLAKCREEDIYTVQRALNRELKLLFDENGINIPFPQIVLNQPTKFEHKTTEETGRDANDFVKKQAYISKEIEEKIG